MGQRVKIHFILLCLTLTLGFLVECGGTLPLPISLPSLPNLSFSSPAKRAWRHGQEAAAGLPSLQNYLSGGCGQAQVTEQLSYNFMAKLFCRDDGTNKSCNRGTRAWLNGAIHAIWRQRRQQCQIYPIHGSRISHPCS